VEPRFGRLYASAVLRPLAEQVAGVLAAQPGETICDLLCDGATLGVALGTSVGTRGTVVLVETDDSLLQAAAREVSATGCNVSTVPASGGVIPLPESSCDRVASLCTLGFWDGDSLLDVAERATRPGGRAAVLAWDPLRPPAHEAALAGALREVLGISSTFLTRCLATPDPAHAARWEPVTLHDVVRFDGMAAYWEAMVGDRPIGADLTGQSDAALSALRAACHESLEPWTAADETMRIPVRATLWCSRATARG
jgi:SAM-dependent methyltransferase